MNIQCFTKKEVQRKNELLKKLDKIYKRYYQAKNRNKFALNEKLESKIQRDYDNVASELIHQLGFQEQIKILD